jgi:nitrate reductase (NAD(P)H)
MPPHVDAELAKAEGWWYKPEYICNDLSINSAIAKPDHDETLKVTPGGTYSIQGYCYTGGGRRITRMEVSLNSGALWNLATINISEKPSRSGKYWCWIHWEYTATHEELAKATEIVLRGWDEGHQTQVHLLKPHETVSTCRSFSVFFTFDCMTLHYTVSPFRLSL